MSVRARVTIICVFAIGSSRTYASIPSPCCAVDAMQCGALFQQHEEIIIPRPCTTSVSVLCVRDWQREWR